MSMTAFWPLMPMASNTTTPISIVSSTAATGVATTINRLGSGRFSSLNRMLRPGLCCRIRIAVDAAHQQADLIDVGLRHLDGAAQPSAIDHRQGIAKRQQFVEILADHHDRR